MSNSTNLSLRMDAELKKEAEAILSELGMNMTTALTVFLRQMVRQRKIPFEIALSTPNEATLAAMDEAEALIKAPGSKGYHNAESMLKDVLG